MLIQMSNETSNTNTGPLWLLNLPLSLTEVRERAEEHLEQVDFFITWFGKTVKTGS